MLTVLTHPNDRLRLASEAVAKEDLTAKKTQAFIEDLVEAMSAYDGVGIAAPQVGVAKRIIVVKTKTGPEVFVNPKIISKSLRLIESEEGCLSVPEVFGVVKRHKSVKIRALDRQGEKIQLKASGFEAIVFQHEIDHLDGILFIDKVIRYTNPPKNQAEQLCA